MALVLLDSENADRDLTSQVTVLTHTPSTTEHRQCQAQIALGDGAKDLDGTGGSFEVTVTVGGQTVEPDPQSVTFSTATRCAVWTNPFPVPANSEVVVKFKSPNAADTDVDVMARLFDVPVGNVLQIDGNELAAQVVARRNFACHDEAYVVVAEAATDADRGTALVAAYTAAKALTPGGNAISTGNRAAVLIPPGRYKLSETLTLDTAGVDLFALLPESGWDRTMLDHDYTDGSTTLENYRPGRTSVYCEENGVSTITQSVSDVRMQGFAIAQLSGYAAGVYYGLHVTADDNDESSYRDMYMFHKAPSFKRGPIGFAKHCSGSWRRVITNAFGLRIGYDAEMEGEFRARVEDSQVGSYSVIGDYEVGEEGTHKATMCRVVNTIAIGLFDSFTSSGYASFGGCGTFSAQVDDTCLFQDLCAGDNSFTIGAKTEARYLRCIGDEYCCAASRSNTYTGEMAGTAIDCYFKKGSLGGRSPAITVGKLTGTVVGCVSEGGVLPWRCEGATIEGSLLTVTTGNQDGITLLDGTSRITNSTILVVESGTGVPVNAGSAQSVAVAGCRFNNSDVAATGLGDNVTNRGVDGGSVLPIVTDSLEALRERQDDITTESTIILAPN